MGKAIEIKGLSVELGGRFILSDCNMYAAAGEKLAISGASGSGKTTLLRALIGRHLPRHGEIFVNGSKVDPHNLAAIRAQLFYLPQDILPLGDESGEQFLAMPFQLSVNRHLAFDAGAALEWFDRFGLKKHLLESKLQEMSGGERKRLGLVQALLVNRPILLLDELTSSVDETNSRALIDAVLELPDTTVVAVTHDPFFMERADRYVIVENGAVVSERGGADGGR